MVDYWLLAAFVFLFGCVVWAWRLGYRAGKHDGVIETWCAAHSSVEELRGTIFERWIWF